MDDHRAAAPAGYVLGDDNPVQTGSLLSQERAVLRDRLGFTPQQLERLDADAFEVAFLTPSERRTVSGTSTTHGRNSKRPRCADSKATMRSSGEDEAASSPATSISTGAPSRS